MTRPKTYIDARGWAYRVMPGLGGGTYKARYCKAGMSGMKWKCMGTLPWRDTAEEAQADLDRMAGKKGWQEVPA